MKKLWTPDNKINKPWKPVFGAGVPQSPSGGGGGGGAWTLISNTPMAAAATIDITNMTGHTHYCAMLRGVRSSFPFLEELRMRVSVNNGISFASPFKYEGRKNSKHANATTETDRAYTIDSSFELIATGVDEGPHGNGQYGMDGWIWFWQPATGNFRDIMMEYALSYENESNFATRTKGFGQFPSFTDGWGPVNAFQLFMLNNFLASGSIDLYGIT